jgi:hypothetical protein
VTEETRITNEKTGGEKGSKLERFDLIPIGPLTALARHYGIGAAKYADNNWRKGYDWHLSYAALQRHANAFWAGEDLDVDVDGQGNDSPHLAAVIFHAMALLEYGQTHPELDNRYVEPEHETEEESEETFTEWLDRVLPGLISKPEPVPERKTPSLAEIMEQVRAIRRDNEQPHSVVMPAVDWEALKLTVRPQLSDRLFDALDSSSRLFGLPVTIDDTAPFPFVTSEPRLRFGRVPFSAGTHLHMGATDFFDTDPLVVDTNEIQPEIDEVLERTEAKPEEPKTPFKPGGIIQALHDAFNDAGLLESEEPVIVAPAATIKLASAMARAGITPVRNIEEIKAAAGAGRASVREIMRATGDANFYQQGQPALYVSRGITGFREIESLKMGHDDVVTFLDALEDAGLEITHIPNP